MIKFGIASDLRDVPRYVYSQVQFVFFVFVNSASLHFAHIKFLKEKKRKKRKSSIKWRFQEKQVFSKKYYPGF